MLLPTLTLLPMLMFVSLPKPGRFPPILGRLISMFGRLKLLPKPGALMFPPGLFPPIIGRSMLPGNVLGRSPPMPGRVAIPGKVVGRFMLPTLPSEGRSPPPGSDGRFCPSPGDGSVDGSWIFGGLTCGRLGALGSEGRAAMDGFEGSVVGREMLGRFPAPPNEGREPPKDGVPEFPPRFGIVGRAFAFPNDGRDMFGALGLAILGMLGRDMFGRAPPPPTLAIDGLAPPPPPPRPRCARTSGTQTVPMATGTNITDIVRIFFNVNMLLFREVRMDYLPTVGGSFTTVI